jgi:hypothetical protein
MRTVSVTQTFPGTAARAEARWCETSGWPGWVDECDHVLQVTGDWPQVGASVTWQSGPAGRGRVTERVVGHEPRQELTMEVEDDSIRGRQTVIFSPGSPGVRISLSLAYEIKRRSLITPVIDLLFIRGPMTTSLQRTVERFGAGVAPSAPGPP